jgi:ribosomal protein S21
MSKFGRTVEVKDGAVEETYIKPTTRRKLKRNAARNRWKKHVASQQLPPRMY